MLKVIVAGGRDFADYELLKITLDKLLINHTEIEIVSGVAKGADLLGLKYAAEKKIPVRKFPADWNHFGNSAGFKRNVEMAKYANACVCFWDNKSKGTSHMINTALLYKLKLRTIIYF